jgi:tRNA pseudouridine13 synthase
MFPSVYPEKSRCSLGNLVQQPTLPRMVIRMSEQMGGVVARCGRQDRVCEEVLLRQPAQTGDFYWLQVEKRDISTGQVRSAIARSVKADDKLVGCAGNRDRYGRCIQWFSIPAEVVDHPGPLKRAGVAGKMSVLKVTSSHKPVSEDTVARLKWTCTLRDPTGSDSYGQAKAIMDCLRLRGLPNYHPAHPNDDGSHARWGHDILQGKRLPKGIFEQIGRGRCLRAVQEALFNFYVSARISDKLCDVAIPGDILLDSQGVSSIVSDVAHAQKRIACWESLIMGPMFGAGMKKAGDDAAARELATLTAAELSEDNIQPLHGARRAIRVQPTKVVVDLAGKDIVVTCELPSETAVAVLLDELLKPAEPHAENSADNPE